MNIESIDKKISNHTFTIFQLIQEEKLNYIYRGIFTPNINQNILSLAESNMEKFNEPKKLKRKVYHVMVEGLQNITRHRAEAHEAEDNCSGFFALRKELDRYFITTGNIIENYSIDDLTKKIDNVNNLNCEELREFHLHRLKYGKLSSKGGAGLGLIDIARRAGSKLKYDFNKINKGHSYFYLNTEITPITEEILENNNEANISNYHNINQILEEENAIVVFNNYFNQEALINILSFLEKQMAKSGKIKKLLFTIMIELFQNIVKHAPNYKLSSEGKPGLFYLSENEKEFILTAGNYIKNEKTDDLKSKLQHVNSLDFDGLEVFYSHRLFDFDIDSDESAGLGFIDLRLKSENKLNYQFNTVDNMYSFYSIRVKVKKANN